jgi:hypothetical protein
MTAYDFLAALHARGVALSRNGSGLAIDAPVAVLTHDDRHRLAALKDRLLGVVEFEPELAVLVLWFQEARVAGRLPAEPFQLAPWNRIVDPAQFYAALEIDVSMGPRGARARSGALAASLRRLRTAVGG